VGARILHNFVSSVNKGGFHGRICQTKRGQHRSKSLELHPHLELASGIEMVKKRSEDVPGRHAKQLQTSLLVNVKRPQREKQVSPKSCPLMNPIIQKLTSTEQENRQRSDKGQDRGSHQENNKTQPTKREVNPKQKRQEIRRTYRARNEQGRRESNDRHSLLTMSGAWMGQSERHLEKQQTVRNH
jgi:hypothetical protein